MTRLQPDQHKKFTQKINLKYRLKDNWAYWAGGLQPNLARCTDFRIEVIRGYRLASTRQCTGNVSKYLDVEPRSRDTGAGAGIIVRKSLSYCWKSGTWDRGLNIGCSQVRHYTLHYLVSSWACSAACCSGDVLAAEVEEQTGLFLRWDERGAEEHVMLQSALTNTCPDLVLPARCWVRTQDVQCSNTFTVWDSARVWSAHYHAGYRVVLKTWAFGVYNIW